MVKGLPKEKIPREIWLEEVERHDCNPRLLLEVLMLFLNIRRVITQRQDKVIERHMSMSQNSP